MFKKLFSTTTALLLAASSQFAAADSDHHISKSAKSATNNCAGTEAQELFMKMTLARQAAIQFVGLEKNYSRLYRYKRNTFHPTYLDRWDRDGFIIFFSSYTTVYYSDHITVYKPI